MRSRANTASGPLSVASMKGAKRDSCFPSASTTYTINTLGSRQAFVYRCRPFLVCGPRLGSRSRRRPPSLLITTRRPATVSANTVTGRRVVISSDGGRLRLREPKRGPQTKKGRQRYTNAWREPKVLIVYVVDAEGKQESRFAPF